MSFIAELKRRNVVKVASVYVVTAWLILQIIGVVTPFLKLPTAFGTGVTVILIVGLPLACIFAWAFELTPEGIQATRKISEAASIAPETGQKMNRLLIGLVGLLIVYVAVDKLWLSTAPAAATPVAQIEVAKTQADEIKVLAVLPFLNLSTEEDQDIFVDGLTEELLNTLVRIPELKVLGRTSSFAYKGVNKDLKIIASELNADYLIEGSVRKSGNNLRITAQLIDAETGAHLFSDNFDRTLKDVFTLQEEVSDQVAAALKLNLIHRDDRYAAALDELSYIEVEQLVRARALANRFTSEDIREAINILDELLKHYQDTSAILGLGAYVAMLEVSFTENISMSDEDILAMSERALELDPLNRDALYTLAVFYDDYAHSTDEALDIYRKAVRAYPYDFSFINQYMLALMYSYTPCEQIEQIISSLNTGALEKARQNQLRYFTLHCLQPDKAEELLATATTDDISFYTKLIDLEALFELYKEINGQNPNQRNTAVYVYYLQLLGEYSTSQSLMDNMNMSSLGLASTGAYVNAYFTPNRQPAIAFDELLQRLRIKEHFELFDESALVLFDRAQNEEKLAEFREHFFKLKPPENKVPQASLVATYALILKKLGEYTQATNMAEQALRELSAYKELHPESYEFYSLQLDKLKFLIIAQKYEQALTLLEKYPKGQDLAWFNPTMLRYAFADELEEPFFEEFFTQIELEKQKLREKLGIKL